MKDKAMWSIFDKNNTKEFIPANKSRFYTWFFDVYTRLLLKRRFHHISINQKYNPGSEKRTVYFLNHNSWWDGLIPLYLNRKYFHQNALAMMEDKQMHTYPFFRRLGAFSINLDNPRSSLRSLKYALQSLQKPNSALYLYPEGKITAASESKPTFKKGLAWLYQQTEQVDFVPIALFIHTFKSSKPVLHIHIGAPVEHDENADKVTLTEQFEQDLFNLLKETRIEALKL